MNQKTKIPDGYKSVWPGDPKATHAICGCSRRELVLKDADSHVCTWTYLVKEKKDG